MAQQQPSLETIFMSSNVTSKHSHVKQRKPPGVWARLKPNVDSMSRRVVPSGRVAGEAATIAERKNPMKANYTRIAVILDRSGSMQSVCEATVAGFNEFVRTQQSLPGEVKLKLVQFDDRYEVVFDEPLHQVPELTQQTFVPRGMTALLDAQGRTIVELGAELAEQPEEERPSKVIVLTLTDGLENASKSFTRDRVAELIVHE